MTAPENAPPVELVDAAVNAWFTATPRVALMHDLQEHFRERMRATLAAVDFLASAAGDSQTAAARDVLAERQRQISAEGWTLRHDDKYDMGQLSSAAGCYAMFTLAFPPGVPARYWPWSSEWWKRSQDQRRNLVKAGALILAEIERLDRAAVRQRSQRQEA